VDFGRFSLGIYFKMHSSNNRFWDDVRSGSKD
jgi:hypothetical protein